MVHVGTQLLVIITTFTLGFMLAAQITSRRAVISRARLVLTYVPTLLVGLAAAVVVVVALNGTSCELAEYTPVVPLSLASVAVLLAVVGFVHGRILSLRTNRLMRQRRFALIGLFPPAAVYFFFAPRPRWRYNQRMVPIIR